MDGVLGIVFNKEGQVVMVKRRDVPIWVPPGGGIEKPETPEQAVIRETFEESGFKVEVRKKIGEYTYGNSDRVTHVFECAVISGKATTSNESKDVRFFDTANLPELIYPYIGQFLKDINYKTPVKRTLPLPNKRMILNYLCKHPIIIIRYLLTRVGIRINT